MRIGAILQARYGSKRLPGKVMMRLPIGGKKTLLEVIVDRASHAKTLSICVLATSSGEEDKALASLFTKNIFLGSEKNVLDRFCRAATEYQLDVIVRLTGDNPAIMASTIDTVVHYHIEENSDYTCTVGLPIGMNIEVLSYEALKTSWEESMDPYEQEHVTPFIIRRPERFKNRVCQIDINPVLSNLRMTVDYPSDYALQNLIFSYFGRTDFDLYDLEKFVLDFPWVVGINPNFQKQHYDSPLDEMREAHNILNRLDLDEAANLLAEEIKKIESVAKD